MISLPSSLRPSIFGLPSRRCTGARRIGRFTVPFLALTVSLFGTWEKASALTPAATPTFSLPAGSYTSVQTLSITDATPGATIYYHNDSIPNSGFVQYTGPITLSAEGDQRITTYAAATGYDQSAEATATYTLNLPPAAAPVITPAAGTYPGPLTVTISAEPGATIKYTTNGVVPRTAAPNAPVYTGPFTVSSSETVVASAITYGHSLGAPASAQYLIQSSPTSFIYTVAGNGNNGYTGDNGLATLADLNSPSAAVVDGSGNLYIADSYNNVIRKVDAATHVITTIAGTGLAGYSGDGGPATSALLNDPYALAIDSAGSLYIADAANSAIRKVAADTRVITTVAGNGTEGLSGDNGPAVNAELARPTGVAVDSAGNLYIAQPSHGRIREVSAKTGLITTVAGGQQFGIGGDGGPATSAGLELPYGVAVDSAGNLYIADLLGNVIRRVNASDGVISTVAGSQLTPGRPFNNGYSGDGGPATSAQLQQPQGVAVDSAGNLYIADTVNEVIRKVSATSGIISTIIGDQSSCSSLGGDGGPATSAALCYPQGVSVDAAGNVYTVSPAWERVLVATVPGTIPTATTATPILSVPAGTYAAPQTVTVNDATPGAEIYVTLDGTPVSTTAQGYNGPIDVSGSVTINAIAAAPGYLPSSPVSTAYTITSPPTSVITTVAGDGLKGFTRYGAPATSAEFGAPLGITIDGAGNLYFTDNTNSVVWGVSGTTGIASIVAGTGKAGYSGDGGPATSAELNYPSAVVSDTVGNLYIADSQENVVRKVTASTGLITTFAGNGKHGSPGSIGDNGPASSAEVYAPYGLAIDKAGNLYIADRGDNVIRLVNANTGIITTIAGNGQRGSSGDGGPASSASLEYLGALALDGGGNLYVNTGFTIRRIAVDTGVITTVAGNGNLGSSGNGGPAIDAEIYPQGLAIDRAGNLYIANSSRTVREVSASTGVITNVVGNDYYGFSGDGGSATVAELASPNGIAFDAAGNLYIADGYNYRIRKVTFPGPAATPVFSVAAGTYTNAQTVTITDPTPGAAIYYTTDGTTPTAGSNLYSTPITVSSTEILQAIAIATGFTESAVASAVYTVHLPVTPTVTITPSSSTITTAQALTVTVAVSGGSGSATPTGSVTLTSGSYSAQQTLASGSAAFSLVAGALPVGSDTLTVTYTPDASSAAIYTAAAQSTNVTVTQAIGSATATVSVTPSASTITDKQAISETVSLTGASGQAAPTGSVTLASGSYSALQPLTNGAATFNIPAGSLSAGADTLTASYSGDVTYAAASGSAVVTVTPVVAAIPPPAPVAPGSRATTTATLSAGTAYSGTMNLTCTLTASPSGAQSVPTCSLNPASVTIASGGTGTTVLTIHTTAAGTASLGQPIQQLMRLFGGGSTALAALLLFGLPAKRRRWMSRLALLLMIVAAATIGCGGGGSPTIKPPPTPATTAGNYTFTVSGTDTANAKITISTNVTVTVQ